MKSREIFCCLKHGYFLKRGYFCHCVPLRLKTKTPLCFDIEILLTSATVKLIQLHQFGAELTNI